MILNIITTHQMQLEPDHVEVTCRSLQTGQHLVIFLCRKVNLLGFGLWIFISLSVSTAPFVFGTTHRTHASTCWAATKLQLEAYCGTRRFLTFSFQVSRPSQVPGLAGLLCLWTCPLLLLFICLHQHIVDQQQRCCCCCSGVTHLYLP